MRIGDFDLDQSVFFFSAIVPIGLLLILLKTYTRILAHSISQKHILNLPRVSRSTVLELLSSFGHHSHSRLTAYPGFHYLPSPKGIDHGVLAFADTKHAWIGGAEPLTSSDNQGELLFSFAQTAQLSKKSAILIPIRKEIAEIAQSVGFGVLPMGVEPVFDLTKYFPTADLIPSAQLLKRKGVHVREIYIADLPATQKKRLEEIRQEWLASKPLPPFKFMNQVEPWILPEIKKYFLCEQKGEIYAFLAAISYNKGKGYYFADVLKAKNCPTGVSELLNLEAMQILKSQGVATVSLGIAALATTDSSDPFFTKNRNRILTLIHDHGDFLFRFKPLHQFKMKFKPTSVEPVYVAYYPPRFRLSMILSLAEAFLRDGVLVSLWSSLWRVISKIQIDHLLQNWIDPSIVVRKLPSSVPALFWRCKLTLLLLITNLSLYQITTNHFGVLKRKLEIQWGFTWANVSTHGFDSFMLSPFLHFNLLHINVNMVLLLLFCGLFEIVAGSLWLLIVYMVPTLLSNLLTIIFVFYPLKMLESRLWLQGILLSDVGASLGIFGCIGALVHILTYGRAIVFLLSAYILGDAWFSHNLWQFNHFFALSIGWILGYRILSR